MSNPPLRRERLVGTERGNVLKLELIRDIFTEQSTTGRLLIDGVFECFVLEDKARPDEPKVHGKTAIPEGEYLIDITYSPRFKRWLPLLLNVPGFAGIRIHPGNTSADTEGCLLPGKTRTKDKVGESRDAFAALYAKLHSAWLKKQPLSIEIKSQED